MTERQKTGCGIGKAIANAPKGRQTMQAESQGRLEVIAGCMFSGKTEELLRLVERERIAKKRLLLLKPGNETRYSKEEVVTHYGRSYPCSRVPQDVSYAAIIQIIGDDLVNAQVVGFDDAQFFGNAFPEICKGLALSGKRVIVAGLDNNFRGEPFGPMPILLALADDVKKLAAICVRCGQSATRTQRMVNGEPARGGPEVLVGGQDSYEARCRNCYVPPEK